MKIAFENYKLFKEKQSVELKPLTILVGTNNAGKSSFTKLLLLLQNSFKKSIGTNSELLLNDDGLSLGNTDEVLTFGSKSNNLIIEFDDEIKLTYTPYETDIIKDRLFLYSIQIDNVTIYPQNIRVFYNKETGVYSENETENDLQELEALFKVEVKDLEISIDEDFNLDELNKRIEQIKENQDSLNELLNSDLDENLKLQKQNEYNSLNKELLRLKDEIDQNLFKNNKPRYTNLVLYYFPLDYINDYDSYINDLIKNRIDLKECEIPPLMLDDYFNIAFSNNNSVQSNRKLEINNLIENSFPLSSLKNSIFVDRS